MDGSQTTNTQTVFAIGELDLNAKEEDWSKAAFSITANGSVSCANLTATGGKIGPCIIKSEDEFELENTWKLVPGGVLAHNDTFIESKENNVDPLTVGWHKGITGAFRVRVPGLWQKKALYFVNGLLVYASEAIDDNNSKDE
jgi:hypothetical protein